MLQNFINYIIDTIREAIESDYLKEKEIIEKATNNYNTILSLKEIDVGQTIAHIVNVDNIKYDNNGHFLINGKYNLYYTEILKHGVF